MPTDKHKKAAISITKLAAQVVTCFDSLKLLNFPQNKSYIEMYSTVFLSRTIEWSQDNKKKEREKQQTTQICWTLLSLTNKLYQSFDILYIMTTFSFFFLRIITVELFDHQNYPHLRHKKGENRVPKSLGYHIILPIIQTKCL